LRSCDFRGSGAGTTTHPCSDSAAGAPPTFCAEDSRHADDGTTRLPGRRRLLRAVRRPNSPAMRRQRLFDAYRNRPRIPVAERPSASEADPSFTRAPRWDGGLPVLKAASAVMSVHFRVPRPDRWRTFIWVSSSPGNGLVPPPGAPRRSGRRRPRSWPSAGASGRRPYPEKKKKKNSDSLPALSQPERWLAFSTGNSRLGRRDLPQCFPLPADRNGRSITGSGLIRCSTTPVDRFSRLALAPRR